MADETHTCSDCGREFGSKRGLTSHRRQAHPAATESTADGPTELDPVVAADPGPAEDAPLPDEPPVEEPPAEGLVNGFADQVVQLQEDVIELRGQVRGLVTELRNRRLLRVDATLEDFGES